MKATKLNHVEIREFVRSPFEGCDIEIWHGDQCLRGFNSLSNDYAWTAATEYANAKDKEISRGVA